MEDFTIGASTTLIVPLSGDMPGGSTMKVTAAASHGRVRVDANGSLIYTPDPGYAGGDAFAYTVTAADGSSRTVTVHVTVGQEALAAAASPAVPAAHVTLAFTGAAVGTGVAVGLGAVAAGLALVARSRRRGADVR